MKLLIVIPALNEEKSIESIIERTLAARDHIIAHSNVTQVDVTVVSDGSTDRTVELASRYAEHVKIIVFRENRGYGAAIKRGWSLSDAEILGFLDADGTCDPGFFAPLCATLEAEKADVVLGCRLNAGSRMPVVRRIGNFAFALMLTLFSSKRVRDTASGMRVVRRSSLPKLMPLPDGLHFTPAMSARAILGESVKVLELDMPYREREGQSKLRLIRDGLRFFNAIVEAAFLFRPSRPLELLALTCLIGAVGLMVKPTLYYLEHRALLEWMIYRFIVSNLAGFAACLFLCTSYLSGKIVRLTLTSKPDEVERSQRLFGSFLSSSFFWLLPLALVACGTALVLQSFVDVITSGTTDEHWSRFMAMSFLFSIALILVATRTVDYVLDLIASQLAYLKSQGHD